MAIQVFLAGSDVTSNVMEGSVTHILNRPAIATVRIPSDVTTADETAKLKILLNGTIDFHGTVETIEDQGDQDSEYTTFTAADPTIIFDSRLARDGDGDYSAPTFIVDYVTPPAIAQILYLNSEYWGGASGIAMGTVASGGVSVVGAPTNFPMYVSEVFTLMSDTGYFDAICTPIDSGGNIGQLSFYNGDYGSDLSASVKFEWGVGAYNATHVRRTVDKTNLRNRIRYLLGPKVATAADPKSVQHWRASVDYTTSAPNIPDPPQTAIVNAMAVSQANYRVRESVQVFDARGDEATVGYVLYKRHWQMQQWLRLRPQTNAYITPEPGIYPSFGLGDKIHVGAGAQLRGGFSGTQRVMEYTYHFDAAGTIELGEPVGMPGAAAVRTTADNEGIR